MASTIDLGATYADKLTKTVGVAIAHYEYLDKMSETLILYETQEGYHEYVVSDLRLELCKNIPVVDLADPDED